MSHITKINIEIKSLDSLRDACKSMGLEFMEGQKQYAYYFQNQPQPCDHAIKVPGSRYEIGVVKNKDGGYSLEADFDASGGLNGKIGHNGNLLTQQYKGHEIKRQMVRRGFTVSRSWIDEKTNAMQFEFAKRRY